MVLVGKLVHHAVFLLSLGLEQPVLRTIEPQHHLLHLLTHWLEVLPKALAAYCSVLCTLL